MKNAPTPFWFSFVCVEAVTFTVVDNDPSRDSPILTELSKQAASSSGSLASLAFGAQATTSQPVGTTKSLFMQAAGKRVLQEGAGTSFYDGLSSNRIVTMMLLVTSVQVLVYQPVGKYFWIFRGVFVQFQYCCMAAAGITVVIQDSYLIHLAVNQTSQAKRFVQVLLKYSWHWPHTNLKSFLL